MDSNHEITSRLKFIGKLQNGDKINTRHMYVQPNGLTTSFLRTFIYQDNRLNSLNFCKETISRAFDLLFTYERSYLKSEKILFKDLLKDLKMTTIGLNNLKSTYVTDTKFCCDMDTLLQITNAKLSPYENERQSTTNNNNNDLSAGSNDDDDDDDILTD